MLFALPGLPSGSIRLVRDFPLLLPRSSHPYLVWTPRPGSTTLILLTHGPGDMMSHAQKGLGQSLVTSSVLIPTPNLLWREVSSGQLELNGSIHQPGQPKKPATSSDTQEKAIRTEGSQGTNDPRPHTWDISEFQDVCYQE